MIIEIVLGIVVLVEGYVIWNLTRKTELLETWIENFSDRISQVQRELKEIINDLQETLGEEIK